MTDKPYDEAKKKWSGIAAFAVLFGLASITVKYVLPNFMVMPF